MTVDVALRVASLLVLLAILHQLFWSQGGGRRHVMVGAITMGLGAVIVVLVGVRAMRHEVRSPLYLVHVALGSMFFASLLLTGVLGALAKMRYALEGDAHRVVGWTTAAFLAVSLLVGMASFMSH